MKWKPEFHPKSLYFLTTTAVRHYQFFREETAKRLLLDTLDCSRLRRKYRCLDLPSCQTTFTSSPGSPLRIHLAIGCGTSSDTPQTDFYEAIGGPTAL
jgi:hypothetical protein